MTPQDDILRAAASGRDRLFADTLTMMIGLAAETHPNELRAALGKVFDLSAVEARIVHADMLARKMHAELTDFIAEMRTLVGSLDLATVERRFDTMGQVAKKLETKLARIVESIGALSGNGKVVHQ